MSKSVAVQARIEPNLKREADHIIHKLGLTASQVVNALYAQKYNKWPEKFDLNSIGKN